MVWTPRENDPYERGCYDSKTPLGRGSDGTVEAEALTQDLFGWKRKQLNQTASASRYYIDHIF